MASATQVRRLRFAVQLRQALDESNISIRALSRKLNPQNPETARSNLSRWLRGAHVPSRTSRRSVAVALGLPADYFGADDDEEDALAPSQAEMLDALRPTARLLAALVRDELAVRA